MAVGGVTAATLFRAERGVVQGVEGVLSGWGRGQIWGGRGQGLGSRWAGWDGAVGGA